MPKVMENMPVKLVSESPALKRDLAITGFYIGGRLSLCLCYNVNSEFDNIE